MALLKEIELDNGVTVRYHRIVTLNTVTNVQNVIEVGSYTSQAKREEEKALIDAGIGERNVFVSTVFHIAPYDQTMTVEGAYGWLKANVADFADAEDVLE